MAERFTCPHCGFRPWLWHDYHCARCGRLHEALYRAEHLRPEVGRTMTRAEIEAEYAAAGPKAATRRPCSGLGAAR